MVEKLKVLEEIKPVIATQDVVLEKDADSSHEVFQVHEWVVGLR